MKQFRPLLIITAVLIAALIGGAILLKSRRDDSASANPPGPQAGDKVVKIPAGLVVTLEEFGDYQCPSCAQLHPELKKIKQEFGPNLNFVFRNLPLSAIYKNSLAAAQAAEAARVQNRFWEMHDLLYENQDVWKDEANPRPRFVKFARDLGLNTWLFVRDLEGDQVKFRIEADRDAALRLGIDGTPTILINGRQLRTEATTPQGIRKGIESIITRAGS
jgi:protein-disulfide isomerase